MARACGHQNMQLRGQEGGLQIRGLSSCPQGKQASWGWGAYPEGPRGVEDRWGLWGSEGQQGVWNTIPPWLC